MKNLVPISSIRDQWCATHEKKRLYILYPFNWIAICIYKKSCTDTAKKGSRSKVSLQLVMSTDKPDGQNENELMSETGKQTDNVKIKTPS